MALRSLARSLERVAALAAAELAPLRGLESSDLLTILPDVVPSLVERWTLAGASVGADFYDEARDEAGVGGRFSAIVDDGIDWGSGALIGWSSELLQDPESGVDAAVTRLEDGLQKRVVNSAAHTVTASSLADPKALGWVRSARPEACEFCKMVANRDALFTRATARFACHERCYCIAAPYFDDGSVGEFVDVHDYKPSARTSRLSPEARAEKNRQVREWIAANLE